MNVVIKLVKFYIKNLLYWKLYGKFFFFNYYLYKFENYLINKKIKIKIMIYGYLLIN